MVLLDTLKTDRIVFLRTMQWPVAGSPHRCPEKTCPNKGG